MAKPSRDSLVESGASAAIKAKSAVQDWGGRATDFGTGCLFLVVKVDLAPDHSGGGTGAFEVTWPEQTC
jgi:hypothetical protein